jgi:hypothetical protein
MTKVFRAKHVLLVLGVGLVAAACGGETPMTATNYQAIQDDIKAVGCAGAATCHNQMATNKLKINLAAGMERANYDAMIAAKIIVPGSAATSPLITAAKGLMVNGVAHSAIPAAKQTIWTDWINNQAPF